MNRIGLIIIKNYRKKIAMENPKFQSKVHLPPPSHKPNHHDRTAMTEQLPALNQLWRSQPLAIW